MSEPSPEPGASRSLALCVWVCTVSTVTEVEVGSCHRPQGDECCPTATTLSHRGERRGGTEGPGQLHNWALTEETWEHTRAEISASFPFHDFCLAKEGQPAHSSKVTAAAWGKGRAGTSPYLARATKKGHRVQLLHGTGALLPASAGTGLFLLHGISKAGWRAGHGGEVGKSWCVRQDFSRGLIAAGDRKQEGKGGRTGQKGGGGRGGETERKSRRVSE